ncbi:MAG TPA: carbohydrate ABC transporter permease [Solirubrobacteraceae bacterium]|nr:carbohydrate ABC transporter permease [Solirubrobacteraceae bacterium]
MIGAVVLIPLVWTLSLSIRTGSDVFSNRLLPHSFRLANFVDAWNQFGLGTLFLHSVIVTLGTVAVTTALSVTAAYGFARYRSRVTEAIFLLILTGLMVPPAAVIIPFFVAMTRLGLYNTLLSVVIGESVFALPFSLLLLRGYIDTIPVELTDAARVDGASQLQAFRYVALPLLKPALATVALFSTISTWNGFLLPLVLLNNSSTSTLTVGLSTVSSEFGALNLQLLSAAAVLAIIPILVVFVAARRYYVQGLSAGAVKQ